MSVVLTQESDVLKGDNAITAWVERHDSDLELQSGAGDLFDAPLRISDEVIAIAPHIPVWTDEPIMHEVVQDDTSGTAPEPTSALGDYTEYKLRVRDELDQEADRLAAGGGLHGTAASTLASHDDVDADSEFDWDEPTGSGNAAHPKSSRKVNLILMPRQPALVPTPQVGPIRANQSGICVVAPPPLPKLQKDTEPMASTAVISAQAASNALFMLRQSIADEVAAAASAASRDFDAKIIGTSLLGATQSQTAQTVALGDTQQKALEALREVDEEEEEDESDEDKDANSDNHGGDHQGDGGPELEPNAHSGEVGTDVKEDELEAEFTRANAARANEESVEGSSPVVPESISFAIAADALLAPSETAQYLSTIVVEVEDVSSSFLTTCFIRLFRPKLRQDLILQRDAIFCLAKTSYRGELRVHSRLLSTLYSALTNGGNSALSSASWQDIGFQRDGDFTTDLRGGGMLGPLQVLAALNQHPWLVSAMFRASREPMAPFPFMVQCINFTAKALQALRLGKLAEACNRMQVESIITPSKWPVLTVFNRFYASLLLAFMDLWAAPGSTASINRIGHMMQAVVERAYSSPSAVMASLEHRHKEWEKGNGIQYGTRQATGVYAEERSRGRQGPVSHFSSIS